MRCLRCAPAAASEVESATAARLSESSQACCDCGPTAVVKIQTAHWHAERLDRWMLEGSVTRIRCNIVRHPCRHDRTRAALLQLSTMSVIVSCDCTKPVIKAGTRQTLISIHVSIVLHKRPSTSRSSCQKLAISHSRTRLENVLGMWWRPPASFVRRRLGGQGGGLSIIHISEPTRPY